MNKIKQLLGFLLLCSIPFYYSFAADAELNQRCLDSAPSDLGVGYFLIPIKSSGGIADNVFKGLSKTGKPSKQSKQIAKIFKSHRNENTVIMLCGDSPSKTAQVLVDALKISIKKKRLFPKLKIVYIGEQKYSSDVEVLITELTGMYVFGQLK